MGTKNIHNKINTILNSSIINNISFLDLYWLINENLNFNIKTDSYYFNNLDKKTNKYYFIDFEGSYNLKNKKLKIIFQGNNSLSIVVRTQNMRCRTIPKMNKNAKM